MTNTYAVALDYRDTYIQTWNVDVQRDLNRILVLEVSYQGTKGTRLDVPEAPNQAPLGSSLDLRTAVPDPQRRQFHFTTRRWATRFTNAGQLRLTRRFAKGISAQPALHVLESDGRRGAGAEFLRSGGGARAFDAINHTHVLALQLGAGLAGGCHQGIPIASRFSGQGAEGLDALRIVDRADRCSRRRRPSTGTSMERLARAASRRCHRDCRSIPAQAGSTPRLSSHRLREPSAPRAATPSSDPDRLC